MCVCLGFNDCLVAAVIAMTFIYKERLTCLKRFPISTMKLWDRLLVFL